MADVSPVPAPGGRTILGLKPRTAMIAGGVILAAALGYMLWRRRQSSTTAAGATSSSAAGGYGVDYGGQLSTIQSELEDLLAAEGQQPSSSGGGGTAGGGGGGGTTSGGGGGGQDCPGGFHWDAAQGKCVPGLGEQGTGGGTGGGGGGTTTKTRPGTPTAVHPTRTTSNAVTLTWNKAPNATSYKVHATYQGKPVGSQQSVNGTSATISGLHPDHTYTFHVAAIGPGGESSETNGPTVKTSR